MKRAQRDEIAALVFSLSDSSVGFRRRWRIIAGLALWLTLSGFTILIYNLYVEQSIHSYIIIILGLLKYIPMLIAGYILAKKMAGEYLDDIYELNNEDLAYEFIEEAAFGNGKEEITIADGKIHENDEVSPIILIGGPGKIKINLGSAALLERVDGKPHVITPRKESWILGRFERIREIGKEDGVGKREYAIVNLRDQFKDKLVVRSRTKDGIPIEVTGIKVMFHILRKDPESRIPKAKGLTLNLKAMQTLVYQQAIISPEMKLSSSIGFPWDSTAIPLIITELENIITSHALSELLSNISQKEVDTAEKNEEMLNQMKFQLTGQHSAATSTKKNMEVPNFFSRDKIEQFFASPEFQKKAADFGIEIEWIDIGTWNILSDEIRNKLKNAEELMEKNIAKRKKVETSRKMHEMEEIMHLVQNVIISNYETATSRKVNIKDIEKLQQLIKDYPELIKDPEYTQFVVKQTESTKNPAIVAADLIKSFRKELLAGRILILRENKPDKDKQADLIKIEKALEAISKLDIKESP